MKKIVKLLTLTGAAAALVSCGNKASGEFKYLIDEFADLKVMRYDVPGWEELSLQQKEYVYHLAEAAKWGRDIYWDQNCKYNLELRKAVEKVLENYSGDRKGADFENFVIYAKRLFFSNGIHHHYAEDKFFPDCPKEYFASLLENAGVENRDFLLKLVYDPEFLPQRKASEGEDIVKASAVNFYEGVSRDEVEAYYASLGDPNDPCPPSYGLNSKVVKDAEGKVVEEVWNIEGAYGPAIARIVEELEKAAKVAENDSQRKYIADLVAYYRSGDLRLWDRYNIEWLQDTVGTVDFVNGFVEDYNDPLARKGAWEALVNFKDNEASRRTELISENAQWFEDNSPVDPRFKKAQVKGVSAKVINAVALSGDCYPATPIGINLPNADWIRRDHGSKSVTIANITHAYSCAAQESPKSSPSTRRKSIWPRNTSTSPTTFTPTCTSVSDTAPDSCSRAPRQMPSRNTAPPSRKPAPTSSASIIWPTLSSWSWAYSRIWRHTRPSTPTTYATVLWCSSAAWSSDVLTPSHTCRTANSLPSGAMSTDRTSTSATTRAAATPPLSRKWCATARHIS